MKGLHSSFLGELATINVTGAFSALGLARGDRSGLLQLWTCQACPEFGIHWWVERRSRIQATGDDTLSLCPPPLLTTHPDPVSFALRHSPGLWLHLTSHQTRQFPLLTLRLEVVLTLLVCSPFPSLNDSSHPQSNSGLQDPTAAAPARCWCAGADSVTGSFKRTEHLMVGVC